MKKIISFLLIFAMMFALVACGNEKQEESDNMINVDKNLIDVTVNLPASFFEDKTAEEIMTDAENNGIKSCTVNEDGSVTYVMSKSKYNEMKEETYNSFADECQQKIDDTEDYAYISDIKFNDSISEISVYIDKDYDKELDFVTIIGYYMMGVYYQSFLGIPSDEIDVRITEIDDATGEEIDSYALSDMQNAAEEETTSYVKLGVKLLWVIL